MEERLVQTEERLLTLASDTHERLVDVEERVDFTERVLQQHRSKGQLPEGS
jgi:tetrahydromethanopterin S-methyltransferase subunit G